MTASRTKYSYRGPGDHRPIRSACRDLLSDDRYQLHYLDSAAGPTAVVTAGTPSDLSPVVLLPGALSPAAAMTAAIDAVGRTRQVLVPEPPGMPGLSTPHRPARDQWSSYGHWLDTVLPQLTSEPVLVVGQGSGAAIAVSSSLRHQITGLVLVAPTGLTPIRRPVRVRWHQWRWRADPDSRTTGRLLRLLTGPDFRATPPIAVLYSIIGAYYRPPRIVPPVEEERICRWARHVPVTVALGACDPLAGVPEHYALAARIPSVSIEMLDRIGHLVASEAPELFAEVIATAAARSRPSSRRSLTPFDPFADL